MYQFLNDAIYDWADYVKDPSLKVKEQTIYRIIINLLTLMTYYYIYRKNKYLIEKQRSHVNLKS